MSEMDVRDDGRSGPVPVDEDLIVELNFVPQWARKPPQEIQYDIGSKRRVDRPDRTDRADRSDRRPAGRGPARERRPPRLAPEAPAGRPKRPDRREPPGMGREGGGETTAQRRGERIDIPPVRVSFLPEQKRLVAVAQRVRSENRAFPVAAMASLFLASPDYCNVKIEGGKGRNVSIYQCKHCRMPAIDRALVAAHVVNEHLEDYFDREETVGDPPAGEFVCVATCGLSGILLGPPNHHSYEQKLREVHQSRFPDMPFAEYLRHVRTERGAEVVEKWKEQSRQRVVYRRKDAQGDERPELGWAEVVEYMEREIVPSAVEETRRVVVGADVGRRIEDVRLMAAVRAAWRRENRNPFSLMLALRGAFKHMGLHVFQAGKGAGFVAATRPRAIDPERAVDNIRDVLVHLRKCPGCTRDDLVAALRPGAPMDGPEVGELLAPVGWLVDRGHIIEFFNGALSVPIHT